MTEWVKSSGNVFEDLGFDPAEAEVLKVKAQLKIELEKRGETAKAEPNRSGETSGCRSANAE